MAYHNLANDSGSDDARRREEAADILKILDDFIEQMTPREQSFVEQMSEGGPVTVKQIFYLRDLKGKYAE